MTNTIVSIIKDQSNCCIWKNTIREVITHHFNLSEIIKAYEVFGNVAIEKAMKGILTNQ
jgi:hypothetical protein